MKRAAGLIFFLASLGGVAAAAAEVLPPLASSPPRAAHVAAVRRAAWIRSAAMTRPAIRALLRRQDIDFQRGGGGFSGGIVTGAANFQARTTFGSAQDAANAVDLNETAGCVTFEGATADAFETRLCVTDPTVGDQKFLLPNRGAAVGADTIATLAANQTFTGINAFSGGVVNFNAGLYAISGSVQFSNDTFLIVGSTPPTSGYLSYSTTQTPDGPTMLTPSAVNSWHLMGAASYTYDFQNCSAGTSAAVDPIFCVHSHSQDTTQYRALAAYGLAGQMLKTLTESSATPVVAIPVASDSSSGGTIHYDVFASDGTGQQNRRGRVSYSATAEGTTSTCAVYGSNDAATANPAETQDGSGAGSLTTGTLTYAWTVTAGTNLCTFNLNAVSSLTQTTLLARYGVDHVGPGQPAPQ